MEVLHRFWGFRRRAVAVISRDLWVVWAVVKDF
jgi:hypothetical protein